MTDKKVVDRGSVLFKRQGSADVRLKEEKPKRQPPKSGCAAGIQAFLRCDFDSCIGAFLGFPDVTQLAAPNFDERRPLKELMARCPAWADMSEARKNAYKLNVGMSSAAKESPGWLNQDAVVACSLPMGPDDSLPGLMFAVYDGHGQFGHEASEIAAKRLQCYLGLQEKDPLKNPAEALTAAFRSVDKDIYTGLGPDVEYSGTTGVAVLYDANTRTLHCGNVGDSRAILGRRIPDAKTPQWEAIPLTEDQKPSLSQERERIELCGGHVSSFLEGGLPMGPERVWESAALVKPGLACSRSLGDGCGRNCGVIPDPVISSHKLHSEDKIILVGTDGIWDSLGNHKAISLAAKFLKNPAIGVKAIIEAVRREEGGQTVDDTTILMAVIP